MTKILPLIALLFLTNCTKDLGDVETQLVVSTEDISPPTDYPVIGMDTFSSEDYFVVCYNGYYFKLFTTNDGGKHWTELADPIGYVSGYSTEVQSVVYMNEDCLAMVIDDELYRSYDGGASWLVGINELYVYFLAAGKYNGQLVFLEKNAAGNSNRVMTAPYHQFTKQVIGHYQAAYDDFVHARLSGDFFYLFGNYPYSDPIKIYYMSSGVLENIAFYNNVYDTPVDAVGNGTQTVIARKEGKLNFMTNSTLQNTAVYNYHLFDYRSIDVFNTSFIAVGEQMISTNVDGTWKDALTANCEGWKDTFTCVRQVSETAFVLGNSHGKMYKARFQ